jgi:hypothetical protein
LASSSSHSGAAAPAVEIGASPFSPTVEEADVVVFAFERLYFTLDKFIQFGKVGPNLKRSIEVQSGSPVGI